MARSPSQHQRSLPPMELRTSEGQSPEFRKTESSLEAAYSESARLFDEAMKDARLRNQDIAGLLGVSESLVQKWRSKDARACPSHVQMLLMPFSFHWALHKAMNHKFGFGREALRKLLDSAGELALALEA